MSSWRPCPIRILLVFLISLGGASWANPAHAAGGGYLRGRVTVGSLGQPNVVILVVDSSTNALAATVVTDADGSWSTGELSPGAYKVGYLDAILLFATPSHHLRPRAAVGIDVDIVSPAVALATATSYPVVASMITNVPDESLVGADCPPGSFAEWGSHAGADRRDRDLRGCRIVRHNLSGANLEGADLTGADLTGTNLSGANLASVVLADTTITASLWTGSVGLTVAQFTATRHNWNNVALPPIDFSGTVFSGVNPGGGGYTMNYLWAPGADLAGAVFDQVNMVSANLLGADLAGATLSVNNLSYAYLTNADLTGAEVRDNVLTGASLTGAHVAGAKLWDTPLSLVWNWLGYLPTTNPITKAQLLSTDHNWNGTGISSFFGRGDLTNTDFRGAGFDLRNATLAETQLGGSSVAGMDLRGARFADSGLGTVDFTAADLRGADLTAPHPYVGLGTDYTRLVGSSFVDANLEGADLSYTDFAGANLAGASVVGADVRCATIAAPQLTLTQWQSTNHDWAGTKIAAASSLFAGFDFAAGSYVLHDADFAGLDLSGARFAGIELQRTRFTGATLRNAVGLTGPGLLAAHGDWTGLDLRGTNVYLGGSLFNEPGRSMRGANLSGLNVWASVFTGMDLTGVQRSGTVLYGARLWQANLSNANLAGADLRFADLAGATAVGQMGGASAVYGTTTCPDLMVAGGVVIPSCVAHGLNP